MTHSFWQRLDDLIATSPLVIDRPRRWAHPSFPALVYPLDYGYLEGTTTVDGGGIDVWRGSRDESVLDAVICTVDLGKRDAEIKLLVGCTEEEKTVVVSFHNQGEMAGILIRRQS
jgi:inorganic pyrophosphatase